jgi:hypothetical protein
MGLLYLLLLTMVMAGVFPPEMEGFISTVLLAIAPVLIIYYLIKRSERDTCKTHSWPEDGSLVCKVCGYTPKKR